MSLKNYKGCYVVENKNKDTYVGCHLYEEDMCNTLGVKKVFFPI